MIEDRFCPEQGKKERTMRRTIRTRAVAVVVALCTGLAILAIARGAEADFTIHLRDRKKFVVHRYQESGDQIRYSRFGGKVSIPKNRVAVIENRETGEKRILNPFYTVQELEALRKGQEGILRRRQRRQ